MKNQLWLAAYVFLFSVTGFAQDTLQYADLVARLYDLEYLAKPPHPGEKSGTFSSFDRKSTFDSATNTYRQWDANDDGGGYIRKEGEEIVVFEKEGPGVIWRFWSALADTGHIRIYIDHAVAPAVNMPFRDFFEKFNNGIPPMNFTSLVMTLSRGRNSFLPIPYNKHCKITFAGNWGRYYHITYTDFPQGTGLPLFTGVYTREDCFALAEADRYLSRRGYSRKVYRDEKVEKIKVLSKARTTFPFKTIRGSRAITQLRITYDPSRYQTHEKREALLSDVWISITWDDDLHPAVYAPLGLFFGTYPDVYPYRSYPLGLAGETFYSNWYMPFATKASIRLVNKSVRDLELDCTVIHAALQDSAKNMLRFHAKWHKGLYMDSVRRNGRDIDWPLLVANGTGRYCGISLHVKNEWEEPTVIADQWWYGLLDKKTIDWWWGEGDEKFFVDGEKFPSTFGTGSEDYIGYAWSAEPPFPIFDSPFASQPETPINGNGSTIVSRFHIADNVPFSSSFEGVIEKYKPDRWGEKKENTCEYQAVAYWYLSPGLDDGYAPPAKLTGSVSGN